MIKSSFWRKVFNAPYALWSAIFVIVPLLMVTYYAFTDRNGVFTMNNIQDIFQYSGPFLLSIEYGAVATLICLVLAYPFAYFLSRTGVSFQKMAVLIVMLPMWMNFLIRTYSWMTILGESGVINRTLGFFSIEPLKMLSTGSAVILGMVYNFLPYMILPIYTVISKMDNSLIEAAQDLGCNRVKCLFEVIVPMSRAGIVSGITMVFVPCVSTFYITQKLGGGRITLIGDIIEMQFQSANNYQLGASLSLVLMILILICLGVLKFFGDDEVEGGVII
ncbi:MAG: ABC transporter permease [Eubacterium sp.]|nr:ABC transporter permease [Eubacterium sp.]